MKRNEGRLETDKINILFTSVGNLAFPTVSECLKKTFPHCKIVGVDVRENAHGLYFCDKKYLVDYRDNPRFMKQIRFICKKEGIGILVPLSTEDQNYFSEKKKSFDKLGIKLVCSDYATVRTVNDKYNLYIALKKNNLNSPIFNMISDLSDFEGIISKIGYPKCPFVVKPAIGKGGSNLYIVSEDKSLIRKDDLKFLKEYNELLLNIKKYVIPHKTLITEYLGGNEYSVDTLSENGRFYYGVVRKRYSSFGGLAVEAEVVRNDGILNLAKKIVEKLKLSYINNIQIKEDANGVPKVLEINPRIPGTLSLSIRAGPDFVSDAVHLARGEKVTPPSKIEYGVRILRFWSGIFVNKNDMESIEDLRGKP